jgi:hypothetical protein
VRRIEEPVHVQVKAGRIQRLIWRNRPYLVCEQNLLCISEGRWWLDVHRLGISRTYYIIAAQGPGLPLVCMEVYQQGKAWVLARVSD